MLGQTFPTAAARDALKAAGYTLVGDQSGKFWDNPNVKGAGACLLIQKRYDGSFKLGLA